MEKWHGKIAVVTGASVGIGAEIVKDLARNGITVVGLARRPEKVEEFAKELGAVSGKIFAYKCDVSDRESIRKAFKWIEEKFQFVHILVNNAGLGSKTPLFPENLSEEQADAIDILIKTNFSGLVHVTRHAYDLMRKSDDYGLIINVNSVAGHINPFPADGKCSNVYRGTKYAVTATTETMRQELICANNLKVRVTSLSPGIVDTDFLRTGKYLPENVPSLKGLTAHLNPQDISDALLYILSTPYHVNISEMTVRPVGERI